MFLKRMKARKILMWAVPVVGCVAALVFFAIPSRPSPPSWLPGAIWAGTGSKKGIIVQSSSAGTVARKIDMPDIGRLCDVWLVDTDIEHLNKLYDDRQNIIEMFKVAPDPEPQTPQEGKHFLSDYGIATPPGAIGKTAVVVHHGDTFIRHWMRYFGIGR